MKIAAQFALPARSQKEGEKFEELGVFSSLMEDDDEVSIGTGGITVIGKDSTFYCRYSNAVKKGINDGIIKTEHLANLVVYASTYKDDDGNEQTRLSLGVPQGVFNSRVSAKELKVAGSTAQFEKKTVKLSEINLVARTA